MNKWLIGAVLSSVVLQFVILYVGFFNTVFDTVALSLVDWLWAVGVAASILIFGELVRLSMWLKKR